MRKAYIVSADIYLLMQEWASKKGFVLPPQSFFDALRDDFCFYMANAYSEDFNFVFIAEEEIKTGLADIISKSGLPVISLDGIYYKSEYSLEITRLVDEQGKSQGLGHRHGSPSLVQQIKTLKNSGIREAVLEDDVAATGNLLERIIELLNKMGIHVPKVCLGIGISEAVQRVSTMGCEVSCVCTFEDAVDEVCERDFYPGVPLSGRLLAGSNNVGLPYLLPFGNPKEWASIPKNVELFSKNCLAQTIYLFREIELVSEKIVRCCDVGRQVFGLPSDETRFVDCLYQVFKEKEM